MKAKTPSIKQELNDFKLSHYENADFESLNKKTVQLFNKFGRLKDKKKQKQVVLDLYTLYLQTIEILFINAHALSVDIYYFPSALFINSPDLRNFIKDNFKKTTRFSNWFFVNPVFTIRKGDEDYKESYLLYTNLIKEVAKDYLDNYDLLNAYKHGYRINAKHDKTTLSLITKDGQGFRLNESDSTITYFSKEKADGTPIIFEHTLNFKIGRVFGKCIFACTLLNNIRASTLNYYGKRIRGNKVARFYVRDKQIWGTTLGRSHFKKPIFSLKKPRKSGRVAKGNGYVC